MTKERVLPDDVMDVGTYLFMSSLNSSKEIYSG